MKLPGHTLDLDAPTQAFTIAVGKRITELRNQHGTSIELLAVRAGISRSHLWRIENAKTHATIAILYKIARALKTDPTELLDVDLGGPIATLPPA